MHIAIAATTFHNQNTVAAQLAIFRLQVYWSIMSMYSIDMYWYIVIVWELALWNYRLKRLLRSLVVFSAQPSEESAWGKATADDSTLTAASLCVAVGS